MTTKPSVLKTTFLCLAGAGPGGTWVRVAHVSPLVVWGTASLLACGVFVVLAIRARMRMKREKREMLKWVRQKDVRP